MKEINDLFDDIFGSVDEKMLNDIKVKVDDVRDDNIKNQAINYIDGLINEKKYYASIAHKNIGKMIRYYIAIGMCCQKKGQYEEAINFYKEGKIETNDNIFDYLLGVCYFKLKDYQRGGNFMSKYKDNGFVKLAECNTYLSENYNRLAKKASKGCNKYSNLSKATKCANMAKLIKTIKNNSLLNPNEFNKDIKKLEEVSKLINMGKINDVVDIFETSTANEKIRILRLLYKNGRQATADKLLKNNREELRKYLPQKLRKLENNKALYLKQYKLGCN